MSERDWVDASGDVVAGDVILFQESVFGGSHRNPIYKGSRTIQAKVLRESYGTEKQQHTFTMSVISSKGTDAVPAGAEIRRKGRNIYRNGTQRLVWLDEGERKRIALEKHSRGAVARKARDKRKEDQPHA